ncbi:MAG: cupredoxin domain-containing protein [Lachnotalea sp.]
MKNKNLYLVTAVVLTIALLSSKSTISSANSIFGSKSISNSQSLYSNTAVQNNATEQNNSGLDTVTNVVETQNNATEQNNSASDVATIEGGVQKLTTQHSPSSYPNIVVQKGVPVEWTISASAQSLRSCNSFVIFPDFNIQTSLKQGDNVLEFTPTTTGTFQYFCSMQMYIGTITVVDDIKNYDESAVDNAVNSAVPVGGGGGCCGF